MARGGVVSGEPRTSSPSDLDRERPTADAARSYPRTAGIEEAFIGLLPDLMADVAPIDVRDAFMRAVRISRASMAYASSIASRYVHAPWPSCW